MEENHCTGAVYLIVLCDHRPLFRYFLPFCYPYILLHFKCFYYLCIYTQPLKTVKARVSQKQVHMMQLFLSHCYAALHLFKEMKLQIRNPTSL